MNDLTQSRWLPIVLLTRSNIFMTFAWAISSRHPTAKDFGFQFDFGRGEFIFEASNLLRLLLQ